ncbi:retrovirus-related pol polyprotein from transposon TNT 1-94 [Tanacetum coccineum]|uniref:Retrovirus-related pol polyprotein from transposon TNT 1-94 n=1 Tax=Tanacetum coccineum TaxID=301880 RepID=A0ABQ4XEE5_9ASTR
MSFYMTNLPTYHFLHVFGALCYPTNDSENLGKLQPKADIGILIGYAPTKKAFRIYNRRTRQIIETIHVDFDEMIAMAFEHSSSGPALHEMTHATISSGLMPNPPPSTPLVLPLRTDWDILFQLIFDELLTPPPIDQDAPSPSNSQTTPETQPPVIPNDVEEDNHDIEVAHMGNDPYFGIPIPEIPSDQSSLSDSIHTNVHPNHQIYEQNNKWTKDHPLENIIGELDRPVSTRLQLHEQALFCYYIEAMQEELNEFERLEVWELVPRPDKVMVITLKWIYKVKLDELGDFSKGSVDTTLFICKEGKELLLVQVYVDDIIFAASTPELYDLFAKIMCSKFKMSIMGKISFFLGLQIFQNPKAIFINQTKYALESLKKYGFDSCDPVDTPMVEKFKLDEDIEGKAVDPSHYHGMIGTLLSLTATFAVADHFGLDQIQDIGTYGCNAGFWEIDLLALSFKKQESAARYLRSLADVPEIYMQGFWVTVSRHHSSLRFKLNGKSHTVNVDNFRDMLKICPKLPGQKFEEPLLEEDILSFIRDLGHTGEIKFLFDINVNRMHQPWRSFATIINKCLVENYGSEKQLKLVIERSKTQTHSSYASGSGADEGTGVKLGVPDVPSYNYIDEQISWKSSNEEDDDEVSLNDNDDDVANLDDENQDDDNEQTDSDNEGDDFVHPKFSTHDDDTKQDKEVNEEDSFDPRVQTPSHVESSDDESNEESDEEVQGANTEEEEMEEEATHEEDEANELYRDVNVNLEGRDTAMTDAPLPMFKQLRKQKILM